MPEIDVEGTRIPYQVRRSGRANRLRIVVTPGKVEAVAPVRLAEREIHAFVAAKRRWVLRKTEELARRAANMTPERWVSGAKVPFRGRHLPLTVESADVPAAELTAPGGGREAFHLRVPAAMVGSEREAAAQRLVTRWLRRQALADATELSRHHAGRLGAWPASIRVKDQKTLWGSCGADGVVRLNWRLVAAPRPVFEYVVVHELCHLIERNHGPGFWSLVARLLPDYEESRRWLRRHGVALG